jgi:hypothetical protein
VTNTAVAVRLPAAVSDIVLPSELRSDVSLTHLENAYPPVPVAVIDISSSEAIGISVFVVIVYTVLFIVTATEPVPSKFTESVLFPVTKNAVAVRLPVAVADTVLLSECNDAVELAHLENALPVAVTDIMSPEVMGISVSDVTVYV